MDTYFSMTAPPWLRKPELNSDNQSDLFLLERIKNSEAEALKILYDKYHMGLYRFLRSSLAREDAEEVVQDVFLTVWRKPNAFRGEASLASWLFGMAKNLGRNQARKQKNHLALEEDVAAVASKLGQQLEFEIVLQAVQRLPRQEKAVIELVYLAELSLQEAAVQLKVPLGTIKSRLFAAREHLRVLLGGSDVR
jgi:RNA polymerase sigma-70 factor, ECF subfamily